MGNTPSQVTDEDIAPEASDGAAATFKVEPVTPVLLEKGEVQVLEVSEQGFRLLRPTGLQPLFAFPWGEIHSWSYNTSTFSFKFYDDRLSSITEYSLRLTQVKELLAHIHKCIEVIMGERKNKAMSDEELQELLQQLQNSEPDDRRPRILTALQFSYLTSDQGAEIMQTLDNEFDKVDVAAALHQRLVDQTAFTKVLNTLDCDGDRDNVWHRVGAAKQPIFCMSRRSSSTASLPSPEAVKRFNNIC